MKLDPRRNGGLCDCCDHLSLPGWEVMPIARHARGVDIVADFGDATHELAIQVKALSTRNAVRLGTMLDGTIGDFWVITMNVADSSQSACILLPWEAKSRVRSLDKDGTVPFWLRPSDFEQAQFDEKRELIDYG